MPQKNLAELLINGPASFSVRDDMLKSAKEDVSLMTWAVYDDHTGRKVRDDLCAAVSRGLTTRLMVDFQTSQRPGYGNMVKEMAACGVQVIYYKGTGPLEEYFGQHRKIFIVDKGRTVVLGGINPGDPYSHLRPGMKPDEKWRDTDALISGPQAVDAYNLFVQTWNQQITSHKLNLKKMRMASYYFVNSPMAIDALLIDQNPHDVSPDLVLLALLASIRASKSRIVLQNAYVVLIPSVRRALEKALADGITVEIESNSPDSVDEPIVSRPIMESLQYMARKGAKVFLRKGSTLHSKLALFDDLLLFCMSYNLHPRSHRLETEVAIAIWRGRPIDDMLAQWAIDTNSENAELVTDPDAMKMPPAILNGILHLIFFDLI